MSYSPIYIKMPEWCEIVDRQGTFTPKTIMEIGSMDGVDADYLAKHYNTKDVIIVEAHPVFAERIKAQYPDYEVYNFAATDFNGQATLNAVTDDSNNQGVSSIIPFTEEFIQNTGNVDIFAQYEVGAMRMDTFCAEHNITEIDLVKIDVEGNTLQVLEGFGDLLWFVKCLHIEAEHSPVWKDEKLYCDIERFLIGKGFIPTALKIGFPQSDSVWVKREFYNINWHL